METKTKVILFGGPSDGLHAETTNPKETIKVGEHTYTDGFACDSEGWPVFYCAKGDGFLSKEYFKSLFPGD